MKAKSDELMALIYMEFGNLLLEFDCLEDAARFLLKSLRLSEAAGDRHGVRRALQSGGKVLLRKGDFGLAESFFKQCLGLHEPENAGYDVLPLLGLVDAYRFTGRYAEAERAAEQVYEKLSLNPLMEPYYLAAVSGVFMDTGRYGEAIKIIEEAMVGEGIETRGEIWIELNARRAWCYFQTGNSARAIELLRTAVELAEDKNSPYRESVARSYLAMALSGEEEKEKDKREEKEKTLGADYAAGAEKKRMEGLAHARLAVKRAVAANSDLCLTLALDAMGKTLGATGKSGEGRECHKYSLAVAREMGQHGDMCVAVLGIARSHLEMKRYREAMVYGYRALHHAGADMEALRKEALLVIATANARMGRMEDAAMLLKPTLAWCEKAGAERLRREAEALVKELAAG